MSPARFPFSMASSANPYGVVFKGVLIATLFFGVLAPLGLKLGIDMPLYQARDFFRMYAPGADYWATYSAAKSLSRGDCIYLNPENAPDDERDPQVRPGSRYILYSYPPLQAYLLWPLSSMPFKTSYLVWSALTLVLTGASIWAASRLFLHPNLVFISGAAIYAQSAFLPFELERGQTDALVLFCLSFMAYYYFAKRNSVAAGIFCALGALLKATPAVFLLVFVVRKDVKALAAVAATSFLVILATGPADWFMWVAEVAPFFSAIRVGNAVDHSLGYLFTWFTDNNWFISGRWALATMAVLGLAFFLAAWVHKNRDWFAPLELAILSLIMNLAAPWASNYKIIVLLFPLLTPYILLAFPLAARRPRVTAASTLGLIFLSTSITGFFVLRFFITVLPKLLDGVRFTPFELFAVLGERVIDAPWERLLTDRRAALAFFILVMALTAFYAYGALASRKIGRVRAIQSFPHAEK